MTDDRYLRQRIAMLEDENRVLQHRIASLIYEHQEHRRQCQTPHSPPPSTETPPSPPREKSSPSR